MPSKSSKTSKTAAGCDVHLAAGSASSTSNDTNGQILRTQAGSTHETGAKSRMSATIKAQQQLPKAKLSATNIRRLLRTEQQRPHTSPRLEKRHTRDLQPPKLSAIGRRTTSFHQPNAKLTSSLTRTGSSVQALTLGREQNVEDAAATANNFDTFSRLGVELRNACAKPALGKREEQVAMGRCFTAIGAALQQFGRNMSKTGAQGILESLTEDQPSLEKECIEDTKRTLGNLSDLQAANELLQGKQTSWLAERDKLHGLVDELRHQARNPRIAKGSFKPRISLQSMEDGELDTDRSNLSEALPGLSIPCAVKPKFVPSLNFAGLAI